MAFQKGFIPWNKGKSKRDYPQLSHAGVKKGNIVSKSTRISVSKAQKGHKPYYIARGKDNPGFKENVGYRGLHYWVRRNKPKSMFCEKCGKVTDKLDCANISGKYLRDISDYRWLCKGCHHKYDLAIIRNNNILNQIMKWIYGEA